MIDFAQSKVKTLLVLGFSIDLSHDHDGEGKWPRCMSIHQAGINYWGVGLTKRTS